MSAPTFTTCRPHHLPAGPKPYRQGTFVRLRHATRTLGRRALRSNGGFTLTELLVAVAIIAILVAIVSVCLARAREYARTAQCLSNLHQLSLAALGYAQHNRGMMPSDGQTIGGYWYPEIKPYDNNIIVNGLCPDATTPADPSATGQGIGTASQAWGLVDPSGAYGWLQGTTCSYGMNVHAGGAGVIPAVAAYGQVTLGGNTNYYGGIASATTIEANGNALITGAMESGGAITLHGGITVQGSQSPNMPGMQPPDVTAIYNQIMDTDNPAPTSGGNTIDFTNNQYLYINGNFDASGQMNIIGSGTLLVSGNVTVDGIFPSQGSANINIVTLGSVTIHGQLNLNGSIYAEGNFTNSGNQAIHGVLDIGGYYDDQGKGYIAVAAPPSFDPRANGNQIVESQPLFGDCIWVDGSPAASDAVPSNTQTGDPSLNAQDQMARFCIDRHLGQINVSFTDGSAHTVPLAQLWQLNWSGNFRAKTVVVP